jgi:hypothetical protein
MRHATILLLLASGLLSAGEGPYFVTYSDQMEEPGNLEIGLEQVAGSPRAGNAFVGSLLELEYGVKTWWTTEVYLEGQGTLGEGALFTGYRIENRFRPWMGEHLINPVLYVEFEDMNGADKMLKEIVGHDSIGDQLTPNAEARRERKREIETKLILSSNVRGWNIAGNLIGEKNLTGEPWEFGYAIGVSRPLALAAASAACVFCRENFSAGVELFGGLGTRHEFGLAGTSHYIAPVLAWELPSGGKLALSPAFGLNGNSYGVLVRFGVFYEVEQAGRAVASLFRGRR